MLGIRSVFRQPAEELVDVRGDRWWSGRNQAAALRCLRLGVERVEPLLRGLGWSESLLLNCTHSHASSPETSVLGVSKRWLRGRNRHPRGRKTRSQTMQAFQLRLSKRFKNRLQKTGLEWGCQRL